MGLIKPLSRQGGGRSIESPQSKRSFINPSQGRGSGGVCASRTTDTGSGLFVSSHYEDKQQKYRMQMQAKAKTRKLLASAVFGVALIALVGFRSSSSSSVLTTLRKSSSSGGGSKMKASAVSDKQAGLNSLKAKVEHDTAPPEIKVPKCTPGANFAYPALPDTMETMQLKLKRLSTNEICRRHIGIDVSNVGTWHTPFTPAFVGIPLGLTKEAVLIKKDSKASLNFGANLNTLFRAYDIAQEMKLPLYITEDSWVFEDFLLPLFFGPSSMMTKDAAFYHTIEEAMGVGIVKDEDALNNMGMTSFHYQSPHDLFLTAPNGLTAVDIRNRRDTILRKMFQYPSIYGKFDACSTIHSFIGEDVNKKYSVIHLADPQQGKYLSQLNKSTGKNLTAASAMHIPYVKNILASTEMLESDIYIVHANGKSIDQDRLDGLLRDQFLSKNIKCVDEDVHKKIMAHAAGNVYMAVLANVYIGNPLDQTSLWVARMRFALGMKNTFIFTEMKGDKWVPYFDDEAYEYLYDLEKLGTPWMG